MRKNTILASVMPVAVTLAYLFWTKVEMNWIPALSGLVVMAIFHMTANAVRNYSKSRKTAVGLLVASVVCAVAMTLITSHHFLLFVLAGLLCVVLGRVLRFTIMRDIDAMLAYALIPALAVSYVATGSMLWSVLWAAAPVGLLVSGITHSSHIFDKLNDSASECNQGTMKASVWLYGFEMIFPYVWVGVLSMFGILPLHTAVIFLTLVLAISNSKIMMNLLEGGIDMIADLDVRTANLQLVFSVLLTISFLVAGIL